MSFYIVRFEDNEACSAQRVKFMANHLEFLTKNANSIHMAGPIKNTKTDEPAGGIWFVEAEDSSQIQQLVEEDPFWPTGLRKSIEIFEWTRVFMDGQKQI